VFDLTDHAIDLDLITDGEGGTRGHDHTCRELSITGLAISAPITSTAITMIVSQRTLAPKAPSDQPRNMRSVRICASLIPTSSVSPGMMF
jgi:hypothetical protein